MATTMAMASMNVPTGEESMTVMERIERGYTH